MRFETTINCPIEQVFDLLANITEYATWLPQSATFGTIRDIQPLPVQLGTTYVDAVQGPPMRGEVTVFERPHRLGFNQLSETKVGFLRGSLRSESLYTLTEQAGGTHVVREYHLTMTGVIRLMQPMLLRGGRQESERILQVLKQYLEGNA